MQRYFIELAYKGTRFSGYQKQPNAKTIQESVEIALQTILRTNIETTTSSRTDAGVHALQNFLHFDTEVNLPQSAVYNANAILDKDIVIKSIRQVQANNHSRFNARSRTYEYLIYQEKNPFLHEEAYFYPFSLDFELLLAAAEIFKANQDFQSFCKRHAEVTNYLCDLSTVNWTKEQNHLKFVVTGNRFLRGMVRALVGTSLQVARKKITIQDLEQIIAAQDCQRADFSAVAKGLKLVSVSYDESIFIN